MEYFTGQDARAVIANRHSTMDEKKAALEAAGFVGENFYRKADEADPLPQTAEAGNPATPSPAEKMQAGLARARKEWEELKPALASLATGIAEKETEAAGVQADIGEIEAALTMLEDKYRQLHIELISAIEDKEMQSIADLSPLSSAYSRLSPTLKSALPQTKAAIEVLRVSFVRNEKETLVRAQEKYDCEVRQLKTVVGELENIKRRIVSELATLQASARSAEGKRGELSTLINETLALAGPIIETGAALQNILGEMGDARVSLPT
jgi:chromosome segregation ATPase